MLMTLSGQNCDPSIRHGYLQREIVTILKLSGDTFRRELPVILSFSFSFYSI